MAARTSSSTPSPYLLPTHVAPRVKARLTVKGADPPGATLCDVGVAAQVAGARTLDETLLVQPFEPAALAGIRPDRRCGRSAGIPARGSTRRSGGRA